MKKVKWLLSLLVLMTVARASAGEALKGVDVSVDLTYASKYLWNGFDIYDDKSAIQPSIDFYLPDIGLGFGVWHSFAGTSGFEDVKENDYYVYYCNSLLKGETLQTDYCATWYYYDYIDTASRDADLQEIVLSFSWPAIFDSPLTPYYDLNLLWAAQSDSAAAQAGGTAHTLGLSYDLHLAPTLDADIQQNVSLFSQVTYNDGYGAAGVDHGWSHALFGASTALDIGPGTFSPAIYFQKSMEDTVNPEDELYTTLSYTLTF